VPCRQLEGLWAFGFERADPQAVISGRHQHSVVLYREDFSGRALAGVQVRVVEVILPAQQAGQHAGLAIGSIDAAFDKACAIEPTEGAVGLGHVRLQVPDDAGLGVIERCGDEALGEFRHYVTNANHRGVAHQAVVQLGFAHLVGHVELTGGPYRSCIHFFHRLQSRDAPTAGLLGDSPIQRTGTAVTNDARMDDHHRTLRMAP